MSEQSGIKQFERRKRDHLLHALDEKHQTGILSGLERVVLRHEALPDLDFETLSLRAPLLGKDWGTPFYVCGMTAGHPGAPSVNETIAEAAQTCHWPMGLGSQRRDLEDSNGPDRWAEFRRKFPHLRLFANLGIAQVIECVREKKLPLIQDLANSVQAECLVIHTNPLQEVIQPEGTPQFAGAFAAIREVCEKLSVPVVLKETGCGFSASTLQRLREVGLAAIDVAGLGGTHWGRIEGSRAESEGALLQASVAVTFRNWGISTVESVRSAREEWNSEIWASGGVRNGLDAAKLVGLGAHRVGFAKPVLMAAQGGVQNLVNWMRQQEYELRVALFCTGSQSLDVLRGSEERCRIV